MFFQRSLMFAVLLLSLLAQPIQSAEQAPKPPPALAVEELPKDAKLTKIVLVAGSNFFKPGEHEYVAGCAVFMDLLRQTPGVFPVLAVDWPKKPETFAGAKSVVFFFDGGDKHALLKDDRLTQVQKLADAGVGFVHLHQVIDFPKELGDRARGWMGAAWEKGFSQRAHWVDEFKTFPEHPITRGVTPFKIDDGWLYKLRFVPEMKGVTPLLRTVSPKAPADPKAGNDAIVAWAYDRPGGGRSFTFTGCHLHRSFAEEGYRRFLTNAILWTASVDIPAAGSKVALAPAELDKYLELRQAPKEKEKEKADPTEKVTLQYRVSKDAFAPSSFVAVINGNITLRLEIRWDLPEAVKKDKKEFDDLIKMLEQKTINGVEFECKGEWVKKGMILRVTTVPQITAEGKKRIKGP